MARKSYRKRYYKRKGRWSPNIKTILPVTNDGRLQFPQSAFSAKYLILCAAPAQETSVTQTYTVKNLEFSFNMETTNETLSQLENLCAYIMYIPEGYALGTDGTVNGKFLDELHPEWIMGYKFYGSPAPDVGQQYQPMKVRTRLARNLKTGDGIILYIKGYNQNNTALTVDVTGVLRWWSKAN